MLKAFAQEGARDFDEGFRLHLIHEGSNKKRIEYCKDNNGSPCYLRAIQDWWYSKKPRIDELHVYSIEMEGEHHSQRNFVEFSIHFGEWNNSGRKGEWQGSTSSLLYTSESIGKRPRRRRTSFWLHCSSKGTLSNILETQSGCGILDKIVKSAGSRIPILGNKIICNHNLRHGARRLHWSCDFSERRLSNFRKARNTKASTQGHVKE